MNMQTIIQQVLLVDDRPENLIALEAILEAPERKLLKAGNGNEALTLALKNDISLILLDVQMPDMDGFEVAELLQRNNKTRQIPVIFCTAISKEKHYMARGFDVGAVDYLFKPIDPNVLTAKVRVFLELDLQKRKLQQTLVQLHRAQQENERLLRAMGEGVIGLDKTGLITFANPAAASLLGKSTQQLIGMSIDSLIFFDGNGRLLWCWQDSAVLKAIGRGDSYQSTELHCLNNGKPLQLEVTTTPINERDNNFSGAVAVMRSVSSREQAQKAFEERRKSPRKRLSAELNIFDRATGANIGRLVNLSESGLRLLSKKPFADGQRMVFSMVLPQMVHGSTTISVDAVVVWTQQASYGGDFATGFRLIEQKPESLEVIRYLLDKY